MPYPERSQDDDPDRLKIALSQSDVREAARLLRVFAAAVDDRATRAEDEPMAQWDRAERARIILNSRRLRAKFFSPSMFGEPAWDILLVLYVEQGRQTIGNLTKAIATPLTTTTRWIEYLEKKLLIEREPHPNDKRVVFIKLVEKGRKLLDDYLSGTPWDPEDAGGI